MSRNVPDEDHFMQKLAVSRFLVYNLPVKHEELFDGTILRRKHETDDRHDELGSRLTRKHEEDHFLQSIDFGGQIGILQRLFEVWDGRYVRGSMAHQERAWPLSRHRRQGSHQNLD